MSARGNALALYADLPGAALLRALNGIAGDLYFTDATELPDGFRVRAAKGRWYRYHERGSELRPEVWQRCARLFEGRIDVRSFGRSLPIDRPTFRTVDTVTVTPVPGGLDIDLKAPSFVWGMVRKIVGSLRAVDQGLFRPDELESALRGERRLTVPMAAPEPLLLWEVAYDLPWTHHWSRRSRAQDRLAESFRSGTAARQVLLSEMPVPEERSGAGR